MPHEPLILPTEPAVADAGFLSRVRARHQHYRVFFVSASKVVGGSCVAARYWGVGPANPSDVAAMNVLFNMLLRDVKWLSEGPGVPDDIEAHILTPGETAPTDWIFPAEVPHSGSPGGRPPQHREEDGK